MKVRVIEDDFGCIVDSNEQIKRVRRISLYNEAIYLQVINYGATITSLKTPDMNGEIDDIVLGYDDINSYVNDPYYFGSTVGRYASRIAKGKFSLQHQEYYLTVNNGLHHLHGGNKGFNKVLWDCSYSGNKVIFTYTSPALEENYPGELKCSVTYEINERNEVLINYHATTTEETPVNLTNHSYFNLGGHACGSISDHEISINADYYIPVDESSIPTGKILHVAGTSFDLREPQMISSIMQKIPDGVDHTFCINQNNDKRVARLYHSKSGRVLDIFSTQPGVQFYTANFLPDEPTLLGKDRKFYKKHDGLCLETQNYPDAVNHANFPNPFLDVGKEYNHTTKLRFSVMGL